MSAEQMESNGWREFLATPPDRFVTPPSFGVDVSPADPSPVESVDHNVALEQQEIFANYKEEQSSPVRGRHESETHDFESRSLTVNGLPPDVTEEELNSIFSTYGEIQNVDVSGRDDGIGDVEYFDIRSAISAKLMLNGREIRGCCITVTYSPLQQISNARKPPNNGTIVIFHLPTGVSDSHIMSVFSQYGEIRQIRGTPMRQTQRFVEYWDLRAAENALSSMNGKYFMGGRISIEFSLPGGFRRGMTKV